MTNIFDMRCPKCGDETRIWIRVCEDGTDADAAGDGSHDFDPDSAAVCSCGHWGTVREFARAGGAA